MITLDTKQGMAREVCELWKGTKAEPADDSVPVVVEMMIKDGLDGIYFSWTEGPNRAETMLEVPLERLKSLLDAVTL